MNPEEQDLADSPEEEMTFKQRAWWFLKLLLFLLIVGGGFVVGWFLNTKK